MCPKLLKCASNDDMITVKAEDDADTVTFIFESPRPWLKKTWLKAVLSSLQKIKEGEKSWRFKFNPSFSSYQLFY
ncbi:hypothetical protein MRB53_023460 [Persea americana]|uniref:Uncharacterized protein n=3 Tax=Persea americana TaxID=3435 RepID=A0ACC2LA15_PERAE|nr:hypothetical protein MRB53_023344 [Persea americana]KAJ8630025.1 hypothetical protein MRB53_023348 [Persea americana]KAJ8630137.1 hypothetical protein MRB53_023460 [Persea americana]